jgi:hypothetical protein
LILTSVWLFILQVREELILSFGMHVRDLWFHFLLWVVKLFIFHKATLSRYAVIYAMEVVALACPMSILMFFIRRFLLVEAASLKAFRRKVLSSICYVVIGKPCCRLVDCSFIFICRPCVHTFVVATQKHVIVTPVLEVVRRLSIYAR